MLYDSTVDSYHWRVYSGKQLEEEDRNNPDKTTEKFDEYVLGE